MRVEVGQVWESFRKDTQGRRVEIVDVEGGRTIGGMSMYEVRSVTVRVTKDSDRTAVRSAVGKTHTLSIHNFFQRYRLLEGDTL